MPYDAKSLPKPEALTKGEHECVELSRGLQMGRELRLPGSKDPDLGSNGDTADLRSGFGGFACTEAARYRRPNSNPKWSPNGKEIAYQTANGQEFYYSYANRYISVIPAEGGTPRRIDYGVR